MSSVTVTMLKAKIERVVVRDPVAGTSAEFFRDSEWFCCRAWIARGSAIQVRTDPMTVEQAAVVAVAIQMAIDWIAEELANNSGHTCAALGD